MIKNYSKCITVEVPMSYLIDHPDIELIYANDSVEMHIHTRKYARADEFTWMSFETELGKASIDNHITLFYDTKSHAMTDVALFLIPNKISYNVGVADWHDNSEPDELAEVIMEMLNNLCVGGEE